MHKPAKQSRARHLPFGAAAVVLGMLVAFLAAPARGEVVDRIVAVVNNEVLTLSELNQNLEPYVANLRSIGMTPGEEHEKLYLIRDNVLEQMINEKLADQEIRKRNIKVDEKEIDASIEAFKKERMLSDEELRAALERDGMNMEKYRKTWRDRLLRTRLLNWEVRSKIVITDTDVRKYYDAHKERYGKSIKYHLKNIGVLFNQNTTESVKKGARAKMEQARAALLAQEPFDKVAERFSDPEAGVHGADLGFLSLEELAYQLRETVEKMQPKEVTPLLETEDGVQVVWLEETQEAKGQTLEEAAEEIQNEIYKQILDDKYTQWIKGLREEAFIKKII